MRSAEVLMLFDTMRFSETEFDEFRHLINSIDEKIMLILKNSNFKCRCLKCLLKRKYFQAIENHYLDNGYSVSFYEPYLKYENSGIIEIAW